jgi:hypothetical protein
MTQDGEIRLYGKTAIQLLYQTPAVDAPDCCSVCLVIVEVKPEKPYGNSMAEYAEHAVRHRMIP